MQCATGKGRCLPIAKAMDLISLGHSFSSPYLLRVRAFIGNTVFCRDLLGVAFPLRKPRERSLGVYTYTENALVPDQPGFDRLHAPEDVRLGAVHLGAE